VRIDPRSGRVLRTVDIERGVQDLAVGGGAVWVTNRATDTVTRVDIRTGDQRVIRVGRDPAGVAVGGGSVWTANPGDNTVTRIDRDTGRATATVSVPGQPRFAAYGGGSLWVTTFASSTLVRIDGRSGRPAGDPLELGLNPTKLTISGGSVYVVSTAAGRLERVRFRADG
jgi:YVTN family beta-propeller protein